jgi:hypothetical protein
LVANDQTISDNVNKVENLESAELTETSSSI